MDAATRAETAVWHEVNSIYEDLETPDWFLIL
jgi:hypothetical protein